MCGIVGRLSQTPLEDRQQLLVMCETLHHRGPDDAGAWFSQDGRVGLANQRLAVIDLSAGGHQPMSDATGQLHITFNGEIYNYRELRRELEQRGHKFQSVGDTEVILESYRAWGTDCLSHFVGMFAFGLYDSGLRRLLLARDRAGEKPLFYFDSPAQFVFGSELKALMASPDLPRQLDRDALDDYLAYGYVPGEQCILQGVRKLPQAHALSYDLETGTRRVWRYWDLPAPPGPNHATSGELVAEMEALLLDAVRRQLVADVPVGIMLSSGIDSGLIAALAARVASEPIRTFTASFPGYGEFDEGPLAREISEHFGGQHTELVIEPTTVDLLPELARQYDEPIADASMVPTFLVSRLIREQATVALVGDGGDELFGGYTRYGWIERQERTRQLTPAPLRRWVGVNAARWLPPGLRGRNYMLGLGADLAHSIAHISLNFDAISRRRLLTPTGNNGHERIVPEVVRAALCRPGLTPLQQAMRVDFQTRLVDCYLVKVDRASMLTSLEVRAPWLDHRLIEFAFGQVPDRFKVTPRGNKILPRQIARRLLPEGVHLRRKRGFSPPLSAWFKQEWGTYMKGVLGEADPRLFNRQAIEHLLYLQAHGYSNHQRLFALTIFELWRREYQIEL